MRRDSRLHTASPERTLISWNRYWPWKPAYLAIVGLILLALLIYAVLWWSAGKTSRQYSPADVVYGENYHASHVMPDGDAQILQARPVDMSSSSQPQIETGQGFYDFGTLRSGQVVKHVFPLANRGNSPLIIVSAHTTCGCTTADFTATEIPPGKVALMTVTFDTGYHDLRGQTIRRGIFIETNDPKNQIVNLWFQATIR